MSREELLAECREMGTDSASKAEKARYRARIAELDRIAEGTTRKWEYPQKR